MGLFRLLLLALSLALLGCAKTDDADGPSEGPPGNLLAGRRPVRAQGFANVERITDRVVAERGERWRSELTSVATGREALLEYDLGEPREIRAAMLQGDGNDQYDLATSADGKRYTHLWRAGPAGSGLQTRSTDQLNGHARFIRITASRGDERYSLSEVAVFSERPEPWPPRFRTVVTKPPGAAERSHLLLVGALACAFFAMLKRRGPRWMPWLGLLPAAVALADAFDLAHRWPLDANLEALIHAVVAAIGGVVLARHYFSPKWWRFPSRWTTPTLAGLAVIAAASYYHFGADQFRDHARDRPTFVHGWDMRVYFPLAKYFRELRYDGLYLASLAAYLDNGPDRGPDSIRDVKLRNLRNNEMTTAGQVMPEIQAVRNRFTPQRWQAFCRDMKYFEDSMSPAGYLGSLQDHGGNATPVWVLSAYLLFHNATASESLLSLTGLIDPLLLAILFYAIARTFGLRAMLVCLLLFGATDFGRFGTNLVGSTLRFDWMVALGLGLCALAKRRWALGGALLAYSGLIRGFPATAALALLGPLAWWFIRYWQKHRRLPTIRAFLRERRGFVRVVAGGLLCLAAAVCASGVAFSFEGAWGSWIQKIRIHQEKPNVNHVGLRNVISYERKHISARVLRPDLEEPWTDWQHYQLAAFERRKPLFFALMALFSFFVFDATRRMRLYQAAGAGMLLVPVFFYPANYYLHYVFLIPLTAAAVRRRDGRLSGRGPPRRSFAWVSVVLLAMCVAQYFTLDAGTDVVFTRQSHILLVGFVLVLLTFEGRRWLGFGRRPVAGTPGAPDPEDSPALGDRDGAEAMPASTSPEGQGAGGTTSSTETTPPSDTGDRSGGDEAGDPRGDAGEGTSR